jgi:hypothetical protein
MKMASPGAMEQKPRWAEMCAAILRQCELVCGSRESLAEFLGVHPSQVAIWTSGKSGPPRAVFDKAMEIILAEHDRRSALEEAGRTPRRRRGETG